MNTQIQSWAFLGASGRVGQLVTRGWRQGDKPAHRIFFQTRKMNHALMGTSFVWAPLDGSAGLKSCVDIHGPLGGMFIFVGATPGQAADMSLNVDLAESCLKAAYEAQVPRVLLASSSAVYGVGEGRPFIETDDLKPVNAYGSAKAHMEEVGLQWRDCGLDVCCLRIGNVAGADALLKHRGETTPRHIDQYADGLGPQRSYIGPRTLGNVLMSLAAHKGPLPACLNIGTPDPVRMEDLATAAGMAWDYVPAATAPQFQSITINCERLQTLHRFTQKDSGCQAIVQQLQDTI